MRKTLLAIVALAPFLLAFGPTRPTVDRGVWITVAEATACTGEDVCAEWFSEGSVVHGTVCCVHFSDMGSTTFGTSCKELVRGPRPPGDAL